MRLSPEAKFPWPVLSGFSGDYPNHTFDIKISIDEDLNSTALTANYQVGLDEQTFLAGLEKGEISLGLYVTCLDTYFCELRTVDETDGVIHFPPGTLYGAVTFLPIARTNHKIEKWSSKNINKEFGTGPIEFEKGSVIAIGAASNIQAGRKKLAPMESIFELVDDPDITEGETRLSLDSDKIQIHASASTYKMLNEYRNVAGGRTILLNSVYLPAVMEVLLSLGRDGSAYENRRWYQPFVAKCHHLDVNMGDDEIWESAQKLLRYPCLKLEKMKDGLLS
jgi:hypothetical protein